MWLGVARWGSPATYTAFVGGLPMMFVAVFGVHLAGLGLMLVVPFPQSNEAQGR
jgi:hypothetical protein